MTVGCRAFRKRTGLRRPAAFAGQTETSICLILAWSKTLQEQEITPSLLHWHSHSSHCLKLIKENNQMSFKMWNEMWNRKHVLKLWMISSWSDSRWSLFYRGRRWMGWQQRRVEKHELRGKNNPTKTRARTSPETFVLGGEAPTGATPLSYFRLSVSTSCVWRNWFVRDAALFVQLSVCRWTCEPFLNRYWPLTASSHMTLHQLPPNAWLRGVKG